MTGIETSLPHELDVLLTSRIESRRLQADLELKRVLDATKDDAVTRGRLGAGFYATEQEESCADEMTTRVDRWLALASELLEISGVRLDEGSADGLLKRLHSQLEVDFRQLSGLLDGAIKPHGHAHHTGRLHQAFERAVRHLRQEVEVMRLRDQGRKPTDLAILLSSPRYESAHVHWQSCLEGQQEPSPDLRRAASQAILALESVARIVAGRKTATLGDALDRLRDDGRLSPALTKSLEGVWGFANSSPGIRHGAVLPPTATEAEARYLIDTSKSGIALLLELDRAV